MLECRCATMMTIGLARRGGALMLRLGDIMTTYVFDHQSECDKRGSW
jgi:hypothetical protein